MCTLAPPRTCWTGGRGRPGRPNCFTRGRWRRVLALVGEGLSNDEIGVALIQPGDRAHPRQPRHDQTPRPRPAQLVVIAYQTGLVDTEKRVPVPVDRGARTTGGWS